MTEEQSKTLSQEQMNCLSAKHLHDILLVPLRKWSSAVDLSAIAVPILLLMARLLTKGSAAGIYVDELADTLAAILLVLVIVKLIYGWQDKIIIHN